jgi:hypothetical protein
MQLMAIRAFGLENGEQSVHQPMRFGRVVTAEVADVDI